MKFKSIVITVLGLATIGFSLPAHAGECKQHFQSGGTYGTFHQGKVSHLVEKSKSKKPISALKELVFRQR